MNPVQEKEERPRTSPTKAPPVQRSTFAGIMMPLYMHACFLHNNGTCYGMQGKKEGDVESAQAAKQRSAKCVLCVLINPSMVDQEKKSSVVFKESAVVYNHRLRENWSLGHSWSIFQIPSCLVCYW